MAIKVVPRAVLAFFAAILGLLLVLPVVVLALPFWLVSGLFRGFRTLLSRPVASWKDLIEFEPVVGWKPKAGLKARAMADEAFELTTDATGWRGDGSITDSEVVVFGDSFAFGYGVDDRSMYTAVTPGVRVKPIGVNGYNLVQSYLWMERYAPLLDGKLVVWLVYHGNDLFENLCPNLDHYRMPFVRRSVGGDWEIVTEHVGPHPWPYPSQRPYLQKLAEICSGGPLSDRAFSACAFLVDRAARLCADAGAELVVVSAPDASQIEPRGIDRLRAMSREPARFDPDLPDLRIREICEELGLRFMTLKDHIGADDFKVRDVHWKPNGHRAFGRVLASMHEEYRLEKNGGRGRSEGAAVPSGRARIEDTGESAVLDTATVDRFGSRPRA